ncbi:MAG: DUF6152 family protein [Rhodospirillaceae bacterium]|nr:DUF6152 family protein [Rhodospirillaceae bacterium]
MNKLIGFAVVIAASSAAPALAHHGAVGHPSRYLAGNLIEVEGEITAVFWRNPHPRLALTVAGGAGAGAVWELELPTSPITLERRGFSADRFPQVGERVRVAGVVSRRDETSLGVLHMLLPNGEEFVNGDRELRWSQRRMLGEARAPDPEQVAAAQQSARSIFRVWGQNVDGTFAHPPPTSYTPFLTQRGRELAALYVPARDDPELGCRQGMPTTMFDPVPMQIVDAGERILIRVQEYDIERIVHMAPGVDGDAPPGSPLGYSVGRWEGDTLVVDTTRVEWPYFDPQGTPQSDQTRYTERFALSDDGNVLNYTFTAIDPVMFTRPITFHRPREWTPGIEIVPYDCIAEWDEVSG